MHHEDGGGRREYYHMAISNLETDVLINLNINYCTIGMKSGAEGGRFFSKAQSHGMNIPTMGISD